MNTGSDPYPPYFRPADLGIASGTPEELTTSKSSLTASYLRSSGSVTK